MGSGSGATLPVAIALTSPLLRAAGFRHGFSTRVLDLRPGASEREAHLEAFALVLRFDPARLFLASQVHGACALQAEGEPTELATRAADALIARSAGDAVGVRVADCVPVLLADPDTGAVAAVHAGWRGVAAGVIASAVKEAAAAGSTTRLAAIGPCIGACCFEVGADVAEQIAAASRPEVVIRREGDKAHIDLRAAVRAQLRDAGLADESIDDVAGCTRCEPSRFFSYRREGERAGRHLAVIVAR